MSLELDTRYYTTRELADRLHVRVETIWSYIRQGKIPAVRVGRDYRIAESDAVAALKEMQVRPAMGAKDTIDLGGVAFPVRYLFGPRPDWVPTSDAFWKTEGFPAIDKAHEDADASRTVDEYLYHGDQVR